VLIKFTYKIWPYLISLLLIFFFFFRLFFPQPKLFYTPDFGRSDIWNFNYPVKDFLSRSLKNGQLPFWSKKIATGFPLLAEGQVGVFNIFNLILFFIFPTWFAWNLSYVVIFFTSFLGVYFFLRKNKASQAAGFFSGIIFAFSAFFICHISHFNLIQTASFLPWLFLSCQLLLDDKKKVFLLLFSFILSQQIFSGHPQITFISLCGLSLFVFFKILPYKNNKFNYQKLIIFFGGIFFALCLAAPQILPTYELTQISGRKGGMKEKVIFQYPFPVKHLVSFLKPNFFGKPQDGSYPAFKPGWGIYWENTGYVGLIPLVLTIFVFCKRKKARLEKFLLVLLLTSLLLSLGPYSPLYFLFSFPGFSFFRVPSRFLLLTTFSLACLAGFGFDRLKIFLKKKLTFPFIFRFSFFVLIFLSVLDLFLFGFNYHPLVPVNQALEPPEISQSMEKNSRVYTDQSQFKVWNDVFLTQGWQDINPFLYFKNGMSADLNLLFNQSNIEAFYGLPSLRQQYYQESLNQRLIAAADAKYLITPEKIGNEADEGYQLLKTIRKENLPDYYLYLNLKALDRFYFVSRYQVVKTLADFLSLANQKDFSFSKTVILEKDLPQEFEEPKVQRLQLIQDEDQKLVVKTQTEKDSILVIADSFYPGWQAKIDNKKIVLFPANLNQRALILPQGNHTIELKYYPRKFFAGVAITAGASILFIALILAKKSVFFLE